MNTFTQKFKNSDFTDIKLFFEKDKCSFSSQQYAFFKATNSNYNAVLYNSGKLVIQGKEVDAVVSKLNDEFKLNLNITENKASDDFEITEENYIGIDESGKGDYFGPLIIAGVAVNKDLKNLFLELGIKDSKKLTDEKILKLAPQIQKNAKWTTVIINPIKYNQLYGSFKNLNKLLAWGHARAIENVLEKSPECTLALSDKFAANDKVIENALMEKGKQIKLIQRVRGEEDIAVAAASVVARSEYVLKMKSMSNLYKIDFPKGASDKVLECAKLYIQKYTKEKLNEVAKLHFKTTAQL